MAESITLGNVRIIKTEGELPYELWIKNEDFKIRGKYRYIRQLLRELSRINILEAEDNIKI